VIQVQPSSVQFVVSASDILRDGNVYAPPRCFTFNTRAAGVVLFSAMSVCVFVMSFCLSVCLSTR